MIKKLMRRKIQLMGEFIVTTVLFVAAIAYVVSADLEGVTVSGELAIQSLLVLFIAILFSVIYALIATRMGIVRDEIEELERKLKELEEKEQDSK
jgi:hypothetical protein